MMLRCAFLLVAAFLFDSRSALCRIVGPPETIDLTKLVSTAPMMFRGIVASTSPGEGDGFSADAIADFQVQRWYRGSGSVARVHYGTLRFTGHNCIDFAAGTEWLVFAAARKEAAGPEQPLELADDCFGAVAISHVMSPLLEKSGTFAQIEADFTAGLSDSDPDGRLLSIQRLGGLRAASSRAALHGVIERGDKAERTGQPMPRCGRAI